MLNIRGFTHSFLILGFMLIEMPDFIKTAGDDSDTEDDGIDYDNLHENYRYDENNWHDRYKYTDDDGYNTDDYQVGYDDDDHISIVSGNSLESLEDTNFVTGLNTMDLLNGDDDEEEYSDSR